MLPHTHTHTRERERVSIQTTPATLHHHHPTQTRPSPSTAFNTIRCFLSTPGAIIVCIVITIIFLYLLTHPILKANVIRVAHALSIEIPPAEESIHPYAAVLVTPTHDADEVATWNTISHHHQQRLPNAPDPSKNKSAAPPFSCYGVHAQRGRRPYMEDTYAVYLNHQLHYSSAKEKHLMSVDVEEGESEVVSPWALFGIFDGHGGELASEYTAAYLLPMLHSSLLHHGHTGGASLPTPWLDPSPPLNLSRCIQNAFTDLDNEFINIVAKPQTVHDGSTALVAGIYYRGEDGSMCAAEDPEEGQSTSQFQLVVANLGDCRAIMIQQPLTNAHIVAVPSSSEAIAASHAPEIAIDQPSLPLLPPPPIVTAISTDHKPHHPDELEYIRSHPGGFITKRRNDAPRVQGVLAVSRAIGDWPLKPYVRNVPDIHVIDLDGWKEMLHEEGLPAADHGNCPFESAARSQCDQTLTPVPSDILLIASDGFWDVFTNEQAAEALTAYLASHSKPKDAPDDPLAHPLFASLASHLVKEAYLRGSMDNITVMVVHLDCIKRWLRENAINNRAQMDGKKVHPIAPTPIATSTQNDASQS